MRAEVKGFYSSDIDVHCYESSDPEIDGQWIRFLVGPQGHEGEESFDILICTPRWLEKQIEETGPRLGMNHFIVNRFDLRYAIPVLTNKITSVYGDNWDDIAGRLSKIGYWEFEGYTDTINS
ncbi:MAG: immunity 8 family protein [Acidipropionibacterium acidipropionici]|nr:immunity 8 family protein [Acidipropionibacterium acidipropionici]